MKSLSIIVPVFNTNSSILRRSFSSLRIFSLINSCEVIVVDDGSKETTSNLLRYFCRIWSNFNYYRKPNGGVSSARNLGLAKCKSEYILFFDSDDYLCKEKISFLPKDDILLLYNHSINLKNDILIRNGIYNVKDFVKFFYLYPSMCGPFCKIFNLSIIKKNNIQFDCKITVGEDKKFLFDYLRCVNFIYFNNKTIYKYYYDFSRNENRRNFYSLSDLCKTSLIKIYSVYRVIEFDDDEKRSKNNMLIIISDYLFFLSLVVKVYPKQETMKLIREISYEISPKFADFLKGRNFTLTKLFLSSNKFFIKIIIKSIKVLIYIKSFKDIKSE